MKKPNSKKSFAKKSSAFFKDVAHSLKVFVSTNPVLIFGLSLGPVIAISQSLKAGVSLSVAFAIIIVPVLTIFGCLPFKMPKIVRVILCCLMSAIFFIPAFWFAQAVFPEVNDKVGVFLPLMVVNPIISIRSADAANGYHPLRSFLSGLNTTLSFAFIMCVVSAIREIMGSGTIWGAPIGELKGNISFLLPFMGFIIVGFLAALARKVGDMSFNRKKEANE